MRGLKRNMVLFRYANYVGDTPVVDASGEETGEHAVSYTEPVVMWGSISPPSGSTDRMEFGENVRYDRVITLFPPFPPITESSVLWIDTQDDGVPHDHIVRGVYRSLNVMRIAAAKVEVS